MFGHVNSQDILAIMPEAGTAQLALQEELTGLQEQGQIMMQEFESPVLRLETRSMDIVVQTVHLSLKKRCTKLFLLAIFERCWFLKSRRCPEAPLQITVPT